MDFSSLKSLGNARDDEMDLCRIEDKDPTNDDSHLFSRIDNQFYFILHAVPALPTRNHEETSTYLNQGKTYEIQFLANYHQNLSSITYRSILRLCFYEQTMQQQENELMQKWTDEYHSSSLFEIETNLNIGTFSILQSQQIPHAVEILWNSSNRTSLFIRLKCTSTDFAAKRHGGEKGVPLRLQLDTYQWNEPRPDVRHLHSCYCKIQLFRLKGTQRKHKANRIRLEKWSQDSLPSSTSIDYTIFKSCRASSLYSMNLLSLSYPSKDLTDLSTTTTTIDENLSQAKLSSENATITVHSTSDDVSNWLNVNHFSSIADHFQYFTGIDLLRLTLDDIRQICPQDHSSSIGLFNQLNQVPVQPLKTLYIKMIDEDIYSAIYLHSLTRRELEKKLLEFLRQSSQQPLTLILQSNNLKIQIDHDNVVKHSLVNEARFDLKIVFPQLILCLIK